MHHFRGQASMELGPEGVSQNQFDKLSETCYESRELCEEAIYSSHAGRVDVYHYIHI